MNINNYPLEAFQINDEDFYDVDYWNGTAYESRKISGATLKTLLGQNAITAKREIVQFINKTGSALSEGTIVYLKSSSSSANYPEVELADASTEATSSKTIGAVYETVGNDEVGIIVTSGEVDNLDTSMYSIGDRLWLSTTAGEVTTVIPTAPDHSVFIGTVTRSQNGNGRILYNIQNGFEVEELHNMSNTSVTTAVDTDEFLLKEASSGLWKKLSWLNAKKIVTDANLTTSDITTNNVSTTKHGFVPKAPNDTTKFLRGDGTWDVPASGGSSIPQSDLIYVDAVNGVNDLTADRGQIQKPYATVEYALANTTNTGTVTGDTTSGSATLTNVSSTANIQVGQFITGTNIPYNSVVVSKTANTIVLSQTATGSGTGLTLTWWTPKTIVLVSDIVATSNWFKPAFWFDCGDANITWGNFNLFNKTTATLVPEMINGGNWYGNNASSIFMWSNFVSSAHDIFIDINSYYSLGTGNQIFLQNAVSFRNIIIKCNNFDARFGRIGELTGFYAEWHGNKYGLLGGITSNIIVIYGRTETPASINAVTTGTGAKCYINGPVLGSINGGFYGELVVNNSVVGTSFTSRADQLVCGGFIQVTTGTIGDRTNSVFSATVTGSWTCSGNTEFLAFAGNFTASSGKHYLVMGANYFSGIGTITTSGTAEVTLNGDATAYNVFNACAINLGTGSIINNYAKIKFIFSLNAAGTLNNYGYLQLNYNNSVVPLTGTFLNKGTLELVRGGHGESSQFTPSFVISTGTMIVDGGTVVCNLADSKSGLIRKTASGGKLILKGQAYLKTANGLAPLQILSNTGTAQDVMDFSMVGNGASGFRLADTFSDTTYGTAYAPNLLVGGVHYQDTTYSF